MPNNKPFLTIEQLVALLVDERGLVCESRDELAKFLQRVNYYRFTGYARQFQKCPKYGDDNFLDETQFENIRTIMDKDQELRSLLFDQLAAIEIGVRSSLAHELGRVCGNGAFYLEESNYLDLNDKPSEIVKNLASDLALR